MTEIIYRAVREDIDSRVREDIDSRVREDIDVIPVRVDTSVRVRSPPAHAPAPYVATNDVHVNMSWIHPQPQSRHRSRPQTDTGKISQPALYTNLYAQRVAAMNEREKADEEHYWNMKYERYGWESS